MMIDGKEKNNCNDMESQLLIHFACYYKFIDMRAMVAYPPLR